MKLDEQCVQNIVDCLDEYESYPFDPDFPVLRTMQSSVPAPPNLVEDFKTAHEDGEQRLATFLDERIFNKEKSIHAPVKQMKRKTFESIVSDEHGSSTKKLKVAEMEQKALKSVINLVEHTNGVELPSLL